MIPARSPRALRLAVAVAAALLSACSGGGDGGTGGVGSGPGATSPPAPPRPYARPAAEALTRAEVEQVIAQAVAEARARNAVATIAVVDRVGNVLGVFDMTGAAGRPALQITPGPITTEPGRPGESLNGQAIPYELAAISKALTGAYLSSSGNAFSSRTASMIVQQHFPPATNTAGLESGPLFGVQFSQLPCSDLNLRFDPGAAETAGPKRSPLGLSADPGGFPLYKNGVVVGGVGVAADAVYGLDPNILDRDDDLDETVALAATHGFAAAEDIRADRISVDGTLLRYSDARPSDLSVDPALAPLFHQIDGVRGDLSPVRGYFGRTGEAPLRARDGVAYGLPASGVRPAASGGFAHPDAYVLVDPAGLERFAPRAGADGGDVATPLTRAEVQAILNAAILVASEARGQIRQPLGSQAQVTMSVVDTRGTVLGMVRTPDAPIFGIDVSLQKARTAAFLSGARAAADLEAAVKPDGAADPAVRSAPAAARAFLADPTALTGRTAFSARASGNLARPYFPDGEVGRPAGPFSRSIGSWSPFDVGLQSDLIIGDVLGHVGFVLGAAATEPAPGCTGLPPAASLSAPRLANGLQIFPGGVPIYRGDRLIGALGVSGDGIDQDDMISFLGVARAGAAVGTDFANAPGAIRADQIVIDVGGSGVRLRYVSCPFSPFLDTSAQNVCDGV